MDEISKNLNTLLKRTNLKEHFNFFLGSVQKSFPSIGVINNYLPINEGYEDANFILNTTAGKYILKIFNKDRSLSYIKSLIKVLIDSVVNGIPVTKLVPGNSGELQVININKYNVYFCITDYFEGEDFQNSKPTLSEISAITEYISMLNTLRFDVVEEYDPWGNKYFGQMYKQKSNKLTSLQKMVIDNVYTEFLKIDLTKFSKGIIHGDLQRKHILQSKKREYCILDFGCMAYDPKVIELSTYLAWFCLQEDTWEDRDLIYKTVLAIYNNTHHLSNEEIDSIPTLIRTSYAAYYLTTCVMMNEGDTSEETIEWNNKAKKMLELTKNWTPT